MSHGRAHSHGQEAFVHHTDQDLLFLTTHSTPSTSFRAPTRLSYCSQHILHLRIPWIYKPFTAIHHDQGSPFHEQATSPIEHILRRRVSLSQLPTHSQVRPVTVLPTHRRMAAFSDGANLRKPLKQYFMPFPSSLLLTLLASVGLREETLPRSITGTFQAPGPRDEDINTYQVGLMGDSRLPAIENVHPEMLQTNGMGFYAILKTSCHQ